MNEFTQAIQTHSRMSWLIFAVFAALQLKPAGAVELDLTYPADCPVSAQACIDQICAAGGGTLHIEPGTHQFGSSIIRGVTAPNNLFALCSNVKIVGAGTDPTTGTTIDCSNSNAPLLGLPPCLATGGTPFSSQTEQNIEVAGIRFACPSNESNCAPTALIAIGVNDLRIHQIKTIGFGFGVGIRRSNFVTVERNEFVGRGTGASSTAIQKQLGLPTDDAAADLNHDWVISQNTITDTAIGMQITALTDSQIVKNTQSGGSIGIRIIGGKNIVYQKNTIIGIGPTFSSVGLPAGAILGSIDSAVFSQNLICNTASAPALRFAPSNPNFELARWPIFTNGNSNNLLQRNEFLGYDPDRCGLASGTGIAAEGFCFEISPFPGGISDGGGNQFVRNEADPNGSCPE